MITSATLPRAVAPRLPGLVLVLVLAAAGTLLASLEEHLLGQTWVEGLVLALLLGVVVRSLMRRPERYTAGANFAAKQGLEVAVALLGLAVDARTLLAAGPWLLGLIVGGVSTSIAVSFGIGRSLGLSPHLAALVAAGNSICGNSAIGAVAPAIGARTKDVASVIALTTLVSLVVVLLLPLSIWLVGLTHYQYGVLAGMSVYAVPQVLAATLPVSQLSGEVGTLVKLVRVMLLGPAVLILGMLFRRHGLRPNDADEVVRTPGWGLAAYLPWFVAAFLGFAALRSLGLVPDAIANAARDASRLLTVLAMAGLGLVAELAAVRRVGPRVGTAVVFSLVFLIGSVLLAMKVLPL